MHLSYCNPCEISIKNKLTGQSSLLFSLLVISERPFLKLSIKKISTYPSALGDSQVHSVRPQHFQFTETFKSAQKTTLGSRIPWVVHIEYVHLAGSIMHESLHTIVGGENFTLGPDVFGVGAARHTRKPHSCAHRSQTWWHTLAERQAGCRLPSLPHKQNDRWRWYINKYWDGTTSIKQLGRLKSHIRRNTRNKSKWFQIVQKF